MPNDGLHVVLGASGGAGNSIVRSLHGDHRRVRAVNRSGKADVPKGVETLAADIMDADNARAATRDAEVVYMAAQPPYHRWVEEFPPMIDNVIQACEEAEARLVMVDNLYSYGPDTGVISEQTPEQASDKKGRVRRHMTRRLFDAHQQGRVRVAIGRASDYFGPRADNSALTALAIEPAVRGKTIRWAGSLDVHHSIAYLPDIARAYMALGDDGHADGRAWILPHPEPVTGRQFLDMVNDALPEPVKTGAISKIMLGLASPFHIPSREMLGISYQWTDAFVVDDSSFMSTFGPFDLTPIEEAVHRTVEWYLNREPR